jgi:hypothetical protein
MEVKTELQKYLEERNIKYFMFEGRVSVSVGNLSAEQMEEVFEIIEKNKND